MLFPLFLEKETDESLSFDEMILEAAKSIAAATSALVKAASAAQRELIDIGKVSLFSNSFQMGKKLVRIHTSLNNYCVINIDKSPPTSGFR